MRAEIIFSATVKSCPDTCPSAVYSNCENALEPEVEAALNLILHKVREPDSLRLAYVPAERPYPSAAQCFIESNAVTRIRQHLDVLQGLRLGRRSAVAVTKFE